MKNLKTLGLALLSVVLTGALAVGVIMLDWSDSAVLTTLVCGGIAIASALGVFDAKTPEETKNVTINAESMKKAA